MVQSNTEQAASGLRSPQTFHEAAAAIPLRTIEQVKTSLQKARLYNVDREMARMLLKHGRLTDEARAFIAWEYPR